MMDTALPDAAFRLVSHSLVTQDSRVRPPATGGARLAELQRQFPQADGPAVLEALERAGRLEDVAIEMADADRGPGDGRRGPPLTRGTLAARCPGFSDESYGWAVNDGFVLSRK